MVSWLRHNGKKVLYVNFRWQSSAKGVFKTFNKYIKTLKKLDEQVPVLICSSPLLDADGKNEMRKMMTNAYHGGDFVKRGRCAIYGMEGPDVIFVNVYRMQTGDSDVYVFGKLKDALNWLTEDYKGYGTQQGELRKIFE